MCDMDDVSAIISWCGWRATINELKAEGWIFSTKPKSDNWRDSGNSSASNDYLYLRHPVMKMVGKLRYIEGKTRYALEFLYHEKNGKIKPPRFIEQRNYSEADIEPMLEAIIAIQKRRPKPKRMPADDNVLRFGNINKVG